MRNYNKCDPALHGGELIPSEYFVQLVKPVKAPLGHRREWTDSFAGGEHSSFACCGEHLATAVDRVLAGRPLTARVIISPEPSEKEGL